MPSPLAHLAMGYAIARTYNRPFNRRPNKMLVKKYGLLLFLSLAFSMLPDIDWVLGIITGDFGRYHNNLTHSLLVGLLVAVVFSVALRIWWRGPFSTIFFISLAAYEMHIVMDFFTVGRGVMLFWPLTGERFLGPARLFYGLHWSDGLISIRHLWTFLTELFFAALVILVVNAVWPRPFTPRQQQSSVDG